MRTTDKFSNSRNKTVDCGYCLSIVILTHVECLDILWIVRQEYRTVDNLFCQITFMFCHQIHAPFNVAVIKLHTIRNCLLKDFNCFCIRHSSEIGILYLFQSFFQRCINTFIEESHFFRTFFIDVGNAELDEIFNDVHVIFQIRKCHFRFNHPEFSKVVCCIGVFCTECRTECIDITECHCIGFRLQLTGNSQRSMLAEEVLFILTVISGCNSKCFTCTFGIRTSNQWCIDIDKSLFLEECMNCHGQYGSDSEYCGECVCAWS